MKSHEKPENFAELLEQYGFADFEQRKREKDETDEIQSFKTIEPANIQAEIDLHSQTRLEALENTEDFIDHCQKNNLIKILIITGKGSGILNEAIKNQLDEMKQRGIINRYKNAPQKLGGQGAFVVILN